MTQTITGTAALAVLLFSIASCDGADRPEPPPTDLCAMAWEEIGTPGAHDPALIRTEQGWHLFHTGQGVLSKRSEDGIRWMLNGKVLSSTPEWAGEFVDNPSPNLWAPDISYHDGQYLLYYAVSTFGENTSVIGLATNSTLDRDAEEYQWDDEGPVISSDREDSYNAIDPNLVIDEEGTPWLAFGSYWSGIKIVELDPQTMKPRDGAELVSIASRPEADAIEAPFIVHRGEWYYLFVSFDRCCQGVNSTYKIAVGRSQRIDGGYVDRSGTPMTEGGGTIIRASGERWKGPGHNAVYTSGDTSILIYHAYDAENAGSPTLRIEPLYWDGEGWPYVEDR